MSASTDGGRLRQADAFFDIKPADTIIAVMGLTGVGKSTFINHFSDRPAVVGRSLLSCTSSLDVYRCSDHHLGQFDLVDTLGFDDTYRSDTDLLLELVTRLSRLRQDTILLTGIVYLHRISDNRMGASTMRNLRFFKLLCDDNFMSRVVIATTMWNIANERDALRHEQELMEKSDYWGSMLADGCMVFLQDSNIESARAILAYLINPMAINKALRRPLAIQVELVDEGLALDKTEVGHEMQAELVKLKDKGEAKVERLQTQLQQALDEKDQVWEADLQRLEDETRARNKQAEADLEKLLASKAALLQRLEAQETTRDDEWRRERDERARLASQLELELQMMNVRSISDNEERRLRDQLEKEHNKHEILKWKIRQSQARCSLM